jgi:hypothetical protein
MIAPGRERDPAIGDDRGDVLGAFEHPRLLPRERQPLSFEPTREGQERGHGLAAAGGEDPDVVHPPKVPNAGRPKDLVGPGQHRVGQDRGRVRPDGKARNSRLLQGLEHGGHVLDVGPRASEAAKGSPYQIGADRRVAPVDVGRDERAGGEGHAVRRPQERVPRRPPRPESDVDRRGGERPVGHHFLPQPRLDRRRDRGDEYRVPGGGGSVEEREPPNATPPLRRRDEPIRRRERSVRRHLSPPLGPGEVRPHRCATVCTRCTGSAAMGRPGIFPSPGCRFV